MPCQASEQFGVLGHAAHVRLEESKTFLECGELLEESLLSELLFEAIVLAFISSVDRFFHDVLLTAKKRNTRPDHVGVGLFAGDHCLLSRLLRDAGRIT
jgi:hypothetical protein